MKQLRLKENPFSTVDLAGAKKRDLRTQFGALCYRVRKGKAEVLLITSRRTKRWIIPKGWPQDGATPAQSAAREAFEEAGVEGRVYDVNLGVFTYSKLLGDDRKLPCAVLVYPIRVKQEHDKYPEKSERKRKWMSPKVASKLVNEPELAHILRHFDPRLFSKA